MCANHDIFFTTMRLQSILKHGKVSCYKGGEDPATVTLEQVLEEMEVLVRDSKPHPRGGYSGYPGALQVLQWVINDKERLQFLLSDLVTIRAKGVPAEKVFVLDKLAAWQTQVEAYLEEARKTIKDILE
jgi:hypothetical protein